MVPPYSQRIPRVRWYSGYRSPSSHFAYRALTVSGGASHPLQLCYEVLISVRTPRVLLLLVWPLPRSLATTSGISVDFFSSPYLDVSVQAVPHVHLFDSMHVPGVLLQGVSPFGNLRVVAYVQLTAAYRSLSRPSSAPDAKAFTLCSY